MDPRPATPTVARAQRETMGFLLVPQFSMLAFLSALEPLRVANRFGGDLYQWQLFSADGDDVTASNGMTVKAEAALHDAGPLSTLIVCSAFEPMRYVTRDLVQCVRRIAARRTPLGAIDTGCYLLAEAGLLRGCRVTMHWESIAPFCETYPGIDVRQSLFEIDHDRYTCAGGTSAIDLMLHMIARKHGWDLATAVSEQFVHERIRTSTDHQRMRLRTRLRVHHAKVLHAVELMETHVEGPLPVASLATRCDLSQRQMERLFRDHLDTTPQRYYLRVRLDRARQLLQQTEMSVLAIAVACGFGSAAPFSRAYHGCFGCPPREDRTSRAPAGGTDP